MKKIKVKGKLNLNKKVVSKLNNHQMRNVKGGDVSLLACNTTNTLSYGKACTKNVECIETDIYSLGLFCVSRRC